MFNIKNLVNRITNNTEDGNAGESQSTPSLDPEDQHSAEGFLCPLCMTAFASPDALHTHYESLHGEKSETSDKPPLKESDSEITRVEQKIQELQHDMEKSRSYNEELVREFEKTLNELSSVKSDYALVSSEVPLLRQQLAEQIEQLSLLRKDKDQTVVNLTSEIDKLKQDNSSLKLQLAHRNSVDDAEVLKQELVSVQKMMDQLSLEKEEEIQSLKKQVIELNNVAHEKEQTFAAAQLEFCEKLKAQNPAELHETQSNIKLEQCMNTNQQLEARLSDMESENKKLESEISDLKAQKDDFETASVQVLELNKNMHNLKLEVAQSKQEVQNILQELESEKNNNSLLCEQIKEKNATVEELTENKEELERILDLNGKENSELTEKYHSLAAQLGGFKTEMSELVNDNSDLRATIANYLTCLDEHEKNLLNVKSRNEQLQKTIEALEAETVITTNEAQRCKDYLIKTNLINNDLNSKLKNHLDASTKEKTEFAALLQKLNQEKDDLSGESIQLKDELRKLNDKFEAAKVDHTTREASLQDQLLALNAKYDSVMKESKGLQESVEKAKVELQDKIQELVLKDRQIKDQLDEKEKMLAQSAAELEECKNKLVVIQNQSDAVLVQKLEYEKNIKSSEHKYAILMERCLADANEKEKLHEAMSDLKRKLEDSAAALQELGRENQTLVMESYKLNGRQWTDDSLVTTCTTCTKEFTLTNRKHHCRHCGQIFCKECSSKTAKIPSSKNPVRVCDTCYEELMPR